MTPRSKEINLVEPVPQMAAIRTPDRSEFFPNDAWRKPAEWMAKKARKRKVSFEDDSDSTSVASSAGSREGEPHKNSFKGGRHDIIASPMGNQHGKRVKMPLHEFLRLHPRWEELTQWPEQDYPETTL